MRPPLQGIRDLSLKWKIVIPFLFFAFTGTSILTAIGLSSQQALIRAEEEREIFGYRNLFLEEIEDKKSLVLSLASTVSEDLSVQQLLAARDRKGLYKLIAGTFSRLKRDFQVEEIHFQVPPGISFLRVHRPDLYGDELTRDRKLVADAMKDKEPKAGLELGRTGYGIRGVVPVFYGGTLAGTVEVGYSFGAPFLLHMQNRWGMDLSLYTIDKEGRWSALAQSPGKEARAVLDPELAQEAMERPAFVIEPETQNRAFLLFPVRDYSGKLIALLQLSMDRSETKWRLARSRNIMILVGLMGISVSFLLTYLVALVLIRPIEAIVTEAQEIAEEKRESHIEPHTKDEIGRLAEALNLMLDSLKAKRYALESYAKTLEKRVEERTAELFASELRSEEIRLLEEISAHMAHAIRNPLSSAGGFARRLQNALPANDPNRRLAEIIVKEVVRIEDFLKVLFSSIRPFDLTLGEVDVNRTIQTLLLRLEVSLKAMNIEVHTSFSPELPRIQADEERLSEALENILKHASILTPPKGTLDLSTTLSGDRVTITLMHKAIPLSQDDLDKFFFPHIEEGSQWPMIDLSLSRRIIHRHGGKTDIERQENDCLLIRIELPVRLGWQGGEEGSGGL